MKISNNHKIYSFLPPDIEQMTSTTASRFMEETSKALNTLSWDDKGKSDHYLRVYSIDEQIFLNTTMADISFPQIELTESSDLFSKFFELDDFYSNIIFLDDCFKVNTTYWRFIKIKEFAPKITMSSLADYGDHFITIRKLSDGKSKSLLERVRRLNRANNGSEIRDIASEHAESQSEEILESIILKEEALFEIEAWLILRNESLSELNHETKQLLRELKNDDFIPVVEDLGATNAFYNFFWKKTPNFLQGKIITSTYLTHLFPLRRDIIHEEGINFRSIRGNLLSIDNFHRKSNNFNVVISGATGSGKSVLAQKIVHDSLAKGIKAVILDRGGSFLKTAKYHKGNLFHNSFNPLQFKNPNYLKEFIMSAIPQGEVGYQEQGALLKKIKELLSSNEEMTFRTLINDLEEIIPKLSLYFESLWPYISDEIRPLTDITYVDTQNYPDNILMPLMIYLMEYSKNLTGKKIFVFDEVWHLLERNISYVAELFRTSRKHGISCIAISQLLSDFTRTNLGEIILQSSFYKFIFQQDCKESEFFDEYDIEIIKGLSTVKGEYSEFYLKTPFNNKVLRYFQTLLEYELFTSDRDDLDSFEKFYQSRIEIFDFKTILHRWIKFKYITKEFDFEKDNDLMCCA